MSVENGMSNSEPPSADPPSLITSATPNQEGTPEQPILPNEPKQPEQAPDDSPIQEPQPLQPTDLTFPEGVEVDETLRDNFLSIVNDTELSPKDRAQALVDLQVKAAQAASEASSKAWEEMQTKWQDEVRADFGDNLQPALGRIGRLIQEYGSDELNGVFGMTGAGNNIHMIKFLDNIASKLTEGGPVTGSPTNQEQSAASRLFPSMKG